MSLKSVHIAQAPFFYPIGNTPAACLTQSLPPELDADLLLLGCGDIRNILFTVYGGAQQSSRKLDFTCCDLEAEIIARNIITLTLIIDDVEGVRVPQIWNIYYHVFIDDRALSLIQAQARKLLRHARTMDDWQQSSYANVVRFCDSTTLQSVAKLWELYAIDRSQMSLYQNTQEKLKRQWHAAKRYQAERTPGGGFTLDGLRSMAPLLEKGLCDVSARYHSYWKSGTCFEERRAIQEMTVANPLFTCERGGLILHYGTAPTAGFHLSTMYAKLSATSPLSMPASRDTEARSMPRDMQMAHEQLRAWCSAFRRAATRVIIRYVNCDAIALCHVLQHQQTNYESDTAFWFRHPHTYTALVLDSADYSRNGLGPTTFDIIDTSNLLDHLGTLNVLTACTPLLRRLPTSMLRTEMLVPREANVAESARKFLCGDLPTTALLLGLKPVQYWANATATWNPNACLLQGLVDREKIINALNRPVVYWKLVETSYIQYDAAQLARLVLRLYLSMFEDESFIQRLEMLHVRNISMLQRKIQSYDIYTRASLASFLRCIKRSEVVDWVPFIRGLLEEHILIDSTLDMGPHHFQSLFVHVDVLSIADPGKILDGWRPQSYSQDLKGPFRNWQNMPSVVCVTLVVPRKAVAMFADINKGNGTPICELQIQSSVSMKQAIYTDIQMGFGTVNTSGVAFTNDHAVSVREDPMGWAGTAPLVVSAVVSTCALVEYGDTAGRVVFQLKSTPAALARFGPRLGMLLQLHGSAIGERDVFVSRYRPNMHGHLSISPASASEVRNDDDTKVTIRPLLDREARCFQSIRVLYDICSEEPKRLLQNGGTVEFHTLDPFNLVMTIDSTYRKSIALPLPVDASAGKVKIARKSLWIEYFTTVAKVEALSEWPDSVFPICKDSNSRPILDLLHYVDSDVLPKLHIGTKNKHASWLVAHTSMSATMSSSEERQYLDILARRLVMPGRLAMKESLHTMYSHIFGLEGKTKSRIFYLVGDIPLVLICVDSVRLDISNQSVLLDGALIPLHSGPDSKRIRALVEDCAERVVTLQMKRDEMSFWMSLLPAFVERCRQWQHKPLCEYRAREKVAISTELGERFVCTCGLGVFPSDHLMDLNIFKELSAHAVRIAVPLIFASPISPDIRGTLPGISNSESQPNPARLQLDTKKGMCFMCGAMSGENRSKLWKCAGCRFAQYCSKECQAKDWKKEHKHICKQLQKVIC